MYNKIFISYSSKNDGDARAICEYLESNGKQCFYAPRDILPGTSYAEEIINGLDNSEAVILVLSKAANSSQHVLREVERAVSKNIPIFIYKLEEVELSKSFEYFLMVHQWINTESSKDYTSILNALNEEKAAISVTTAKKKKNFIPYIIGAVIAIAAIVCLVIILPGRKKDKTTKETKDNIETVDSVYEIGQTVTLGSYNDAPIEWYVVNIDGDEAILVSKYILTIKAFDAAESGTIYTTDGTTLFRDLDEKDKTDANSVLAYGSNDWETSNIRTWLNSDRAEVEYTDQAPSGYSVEDGLNAYASEEGFLYNFLDEEKNSIEEVFLLSLDEINTYFAAANISKYTSCTSEALEEDSAKYYNLYASCENDENYFYFTRDAAKDSASKVVIITNGSEESDTAEVYAALPGYGIRPAIKVKL